MRTVAIINQKGGCGKTTTSINLAACLARLGQKTLLIDMDPQGHCGVGLAVPEDQIERTILDALIEERDGKVAKLEEVVWQIATDFDLAPSNIKLAGFEQMFAGRPGREDRLLSVIQSIRNSYSWAIIDCPPSVGLITFNALRACDEVVVPVETGYFSLHGLTKMMETLEIMKEKAGKDILIRVLPTLYDTRTKLAREVLNELRSKFSSYLMESTVNFNTKLKEAASFGQPITEYDPGSRGYKDFVNLARELMGHRPTEVEATPTEALSRPAELVQRAKQLAQLTTLQFGKNSLTNAAAASNQAVNAIPLATGTHGPVMMPVNGGMSPAMPMSIAPISTPSQLDMPGSRMLSMGLSDSSSDMPSQPNMMITPTDQKLANFYGVKQMGDEVIFAARFNEARKVLIAGDFNNWSPMSTPMHSNTRPGEWVTQLPLQKGRYRYRFVVDGKWMTDPHNAYVETNQFGELNNVIEVD